MINTENNCMMGGNEEFPKSITEYVLLEDGKELFPDEHIFSNLYYASLSTSLRYLSGITNPREKEKRERQNQWLKEAIPECEEVRVLNLDRLKEKIETCKDLHSCDGFFFNGELTEKCFLIEFKNTDRRKLLQFLEVQNNEPDQILKKVQNTIELFRNVSFSEEHEAEKLVKRSHVMVVYNGKNNVASSTSVLQGQPERKTVQRSQNGRQRQASRQVYGNAEGKKAIQEPAQRFANEVMKMGFCGVTKREVPGAAYPDDKARFASIMSVFDFAKVVRALFVDWNWGELEKDKVNA